ncbi:hypothetical protein KL905_005070 [Ogataea polymorpha]|nr:hypothetical protein KL935_005140 [Ogataea polymorpha]KAG7905440.1 hypothetical protein KL906_005106 [Ogataea polymorpha]KAG7914968.1 hypothetical protein KL905_005070 [Ogataea polymorpha]
MNPPDLCPICLDDLPHPDQRIVRETRSAQHLARTVPCHHYYHGFCINEWAQKANSCPQCRATFTDIELISDNSVYQSTAIPDRKQTPELFEPCSSGYHTACLGILEGAQFHCPVCDSLQDAGSVIPSRGGRRGQNFLQSVRRQIRNGRQRQLGVYVSRDEPDYVALVDEQRQQQTVTTEDIAWRALDALRGGKKMGALDASNTGGVEKFKRPKRASRKRQLSAAALAEHNKLLGDRVREETPFVLSYTPKSLIQALLLRPKLRRLGLSATKYTQVNKAVSRHLYGLVSGRVEYVVWLNKVAELVEREGVEKRQYAEFVQHLNEPDRQVARQMAEEYAVPVDEMVARLLSNE